MTSISNQAFICITTPQEWYKIDSTHERTSTRCLSLGGSGGRRRGCLDTILLEGSHEAGLVGRSLETTVAKLRRRVDELELDFLQSNTLGARHKSLSRQNASQNIHQVNNKKMISQFKCLSPIINFHFVLKDVIRLYMFIVISRQSKLGGKSQSDSPCAG